MNVTKEAIIVDREIPNDVLEAFMYIGNYGYVHDIPPERLWKTVRNHAHINESMKFQHMLNMKEHANLEQTIAIITHHETNKQQPVIISGCVDIGDKAILLRIYDRYGRALGTIVDENRRHKGIFLHTKSNIEEGLDYTKYEFPLNG